VKPWKIVVVLALLLVSCSSPQADSDTQSQRTPQASGATAAGTKGKTSEPPTVTIDASSGGKVRVRVEIADNPVERYIGLRGRESMPEAHGMLFVYPAEAPHTFTMADTPIPLSIAFIDSERRIVDIQDMKPFDDEPPGYDSAEPAQYALEVNQGFFEERGVRVGDRVDLPE
jgi:uncharacterized protein